MEDWLSILEGDYGDIEQYLNEAEYLFGEAESMLKNLDQLPTALSYLAEGQSALAKGLQALGSEGLGGMEEELIKGINEARAAKAKLELMENLADDYRSYADNINNRHSEVRFIFQTSRLAEEKQIMVGEEAINSEELLPWTDQVWLKLAGLFQ